MLGQVARLRVALSLIAVVASGCFAPPKDPVVVVPGGAAPPALIETLPTAEPTDAPPKKLTAIPWETSEERARARARQRDLPLVVFLFAEWATPAAQMDRVTWADPRILERAASFVALRLDVSDADANAQAAADRFDLGMMPSTLIFDATGTEVARLQGFATADDVLEVLAPLTLRAP